jgi:hypothetical protein
VVLDLLERLARTLQQPRQMGSWAVSVAPAVQAALVSLRLLRHLQLLAVPCKQRLMIWEMASPSHPSDTDPLVGAHQPLLLSAPFAMERTVHLIRLMVREVAAAHQALPLVGQLGGAVTEGAAAVVAVVARGTTQTAVVVVPVVRAA